jgi:hypothetical protein
MPMNFALEASLPVLMLATIVLMAIAMFLSIDVLGIVITVVLMALVFVLWMVIVTAGMPLELAQVFPLPPVACVASGTPLECLGDAIDYQVVLSVLTPLDGQLVTPYRPAKVSRVLRALEMTVRRKLYLK